MSMSSSINISIIMNMSMGISSMDISTICNKQRVEGKNAWQLQVV